MYHVSLNFYTFMPFARSGARKDKMKTCKDSVVNAKYYLFSNEPSVN